MLSIFFLKHHKYVERLWRSDRKHTWYDVSGNVYLTHPLVSVNYINWNWGRGGAKWHSGSWFSSVQSHDRLGRQGHERRFSRDPLAIFSAGGPCEQFWHGQICPLFDVVRPAFPLPTTASPTLQGAPKDGFGEAVVACDVPEPCKFPSLDSCQKKFL